MNNKTEKYTLRELMKQKRAELKTAQRKDLTNIIHHNLWQLINQISPQIVFCYLSFSSEIETHSVILELIKQKKIVLIPKIIDRQMYPIRIHNLDNLQPDKWGILQPMSNQIFTNPIDLCLTPGLAFSEAGKRLGYGGGYYDQCITAHPETLFAGLAFSFQVLPDLPSSPFDQFVDCLVTDQGITWCRPQEKNRLLTIKQSSSK